MMAVRVTTAQLRALMKGGPMPAAGASKYHAKPTTYNGVTYASAMEAARAEALDDFVKVDAVEWWIAHPTFRLGVPENKYVADFLVVNAGGKVHVEDVKGTQTPKFKRDRKLWARYGPCPLHVISKTGVEVIPGGADVNGPDA